MRRLPLIFLLLISLLFMPGFVCATRVERLEGEVDALRIQFEEIQQRINDDQTQMSEMVLRADGKLGELEELQMRANELLKRNSVDLALQIDQQKTELAELRGQLEAGSRRLGQLENEVKAVVGSLGATGGGQAVVLPSDKEGLWTFSENAYTAQKWGEARAGYAEFIARHASDARVESALLRLAESYQKDGMYPESIKTVRAFLEQFGSSKSVTEAIWIMGESAEAMGDCKTATVAFDNLKGTKDKGAAAKTKLKQLQAKCP